MIVCEIEQQIEEAVSMAHDGRRLQRKPCYFVSETEYRRLTAQERIAARAKDQLVSCQRKITALYMWVAAISVLAGGIFIAATLQKIMNPVFGCFVIGGCAAGFALGLRGWWTCRK